MSAKRLARRKWLGNHRYEVENYATTQLAMLMKREGLFAQTTSIRVIADTITRDCLKLKLKSKSAVNVRELASAIAGSCRPSI